MTKPAGMEKCAPKPGIQPCQHAAASTAKQQQSNNASAAKPHAKRIKCVRLLPLINAPIQYVQRPTVQQHRQVKNNANVVQNHAVVSLTVVGVKPLQMSL
jgi:hypothetical protein